MGWPCGVVGFRKETDDAEGPALAMRTALRSLDGSEATLAGVSPSLLSHSSQASPVYSQVS